MKHLNSVERFKRAELQAKICLYITAFCLGVVFFLLCFWSV